MINESEINIYDLFHRESSEGNPEPNFTNTLVEYRNDTIHKVLTVEVFLKEEYPAVIFCIYCNGEGLFASNTLDQAVAEYNSLK